MHAKRIVGEVFLAGKVLTTYFELLKKHSENSVYHSRYTKMSLTWSRLTEQSGDTINYVLYQKAL